MSIQEPHIVRMTASQTPSGKVFLSTSHTEQTNHDKFWQMHGVVEGQLSVDVFTSETEISVVAPMAGADATSLSVMLHDDVLTIRGVRDCPVHTDIEQVVHQECFWGPFSRTVVLPHAVQSHKVVAEYLNGVLVVRLTKQQSTARIPIHIVDE